MARTIDQDRRDALVQAVADHLIREGHALDSLRGLAAAIGTSARMLIHHFGTRERLIGAALERVRERQLQRAREVIAPGGDAIATLQDAWRWFERKDTRRYFMLFEDVEFRERLRPSISSALVSRLGSDWLPLFTDVFRSDARFARDADLLAHLVVVTLRGFARDRASGAGASGQRRAFQALLDMIAARVRSN